MNHPEESRTKADQTDSHRPELPCPAEPAILRYLRILWRRKCLIVFGSLLPAVVVGVVLYFWPYKYSTTFVYEYPVTETTYEVLLHRFYSSENLRRIIGRLRESGVEDYAEKLNRARTERALQKLIQFETLPALPKRVPTTDPAISERITVFEPQLISIEITGYSKEGVSTVADIVTDSFENVLPVYDARNALTESIRELKSLAAEIEENRFRLALEIQQEKTRLEQLSNALAQTAEVPQGDVVIELTDAQGNQEFLPLTYQVRAARSKIIDLQEEADGEQRKYEYYLAVLDFDGSALEKIDESIPAYYTIQQFVDYLGKRLAQIDDEALADHIQSSIRKMENLASVGRRVSRQPVIYPVSKHVAVRSVLTLLVFVMVMTFAAVVLEMRDEQRRHGTTPSRSPTGGA